MYIYLCICFKIRQVSLLYLCRHVVIVRSLSVRQPRRPFRHGPLSVRPPRRRRPPWFCLSVLSSVAIVCSCTHDLRTATLPSPPRPRYHRRQVAAMSPLPADTSPPRLKIYPGIIVWSYIIPCNYILYHVQRITFQFSKSRIPRPEPLHIY